jgi:hypothetical protein
MSKTNRGKHYASASDEIIMLPGTEELYSVVLGQLLACDDA